MASSDCALDAARDAAEAVVARLAGLKHSRPPRPTPPPTPHHTRSLIRTVERSPEPLALAGQKENPWVQSRAGVVSLCAVA